MSDSGTVFLEEQEPAISGDSDERLRLRVAECVIDTHALLREGYLPHRIRAIAEECLMYLQTSLSFAHRPTQAQFVGERVLQQSNVAFFFLLADVISQGGSMGLVLRDSTVLGSLFAVSLSATLLGCFLEGYHLWCVYKAKQLQSRDAEGTTAQAAARRSSVPSASMSLRTDRTKSFLPGTASVANQQEEHCETADKQPKTTAANYNNNNNNNKSFSPHFSPGFADAHVDSSVMTRQEDATVMATAAKVAEVVGWIMLTSPLASLILVVLASRSTGCVEGDALLRQQHSEMQRAFNCRYYMRTRVAMMCCFSMLTQTPRFPAVIVTSIILVAFLLLHSFSFLEDEDVTVAVRASKFVLALMVALLHVAFRWVLDRAALHHFAYRQREAAQVEHVMFEMEALVAYAAERVPQLGARRRKLLKNRRRRVSHSSHRSRSMVATSVSVADSDHVQPLPQRPPEPRVVHRPHRSNVDFSPEAVVLCVRVLDFAGFARQTRPYPRAVATATLMARVHEAVSHAVEGGLDGVAPDRPDITDRSEDTYTAVFGLVDAEAEDGDSIVENVSEQDDAHAHGRRRREATMRSVLAAVRCMSTLANLSDQFAAKKDESGVFPRFPELCMSLHIGPVLGTVPALAQHGSARGSGACAPAPRMGSGSRYCLQGEGLDGAKAMLGACCSPDNIILLSDAAVRALGPAVSDIGPPDSHFAVSVGGDVFGRPPTSVIDVFASVTIELNTSVPVTPNPNHEERSNSEPLSMTMAAGPAAYVPEQELMHEQAAPLPPRNSRRRCTCMTAMGPFLPSRSTAVASTRCTGLIPARAPPLVVFL